MKKETKIKPKKIFIGNVKELKTSNPLYFNHQLLKKNQRKTSEVFI